MPLSTLAAQNLATSTKTVPLWEGITPRWILKLLPWVQVKAGIYRINRVTKAAQVSAEHKEGAALPRTFVDYEEKPREITLATVQTVLEVHTRIPDLHSAPHDQLREQIRLTVEAIKEEKERRLINSTDFGLLTVAAKHMRLPTLAGPPTPDDLDNLLAKVWKMPAFFVAHPRALAAFGRECNARGLPLESVEMFGVSFASWRGVPILPCDKLPIAKTDGRDSTSILLMRVGEQEQGVVGLHQEGIGDEHLQSLAVRFMGIDQQGTASYLVTCYFSVAVLVDDALGVLEKVSV
ncbi:MAG: family 2A encapsulin nanocompartment shell protein [Gemmataceae bacterium]